MKVQRLCSVIATFLAAGCNRVPTDDSDWRGACVCDAGPPPADIGSSPTGGATIDCPTMNEGLNTICLASGVCRDVYVRDFGQGGPLAIYWHGTFESATGVQGYGAGAAVLAMTQAEGGVAVYPEQDPEAVARSGNPFPWWVVHSDCSMPDAQCDRQDDFELSDAIVQCLDGRVDANRVVTGGMSAGGIFSSHLLVDRAYLAGASIWSGGIEEPVVPVSYAPAMVVHGGPADCYSGPGAGPSGQYCFDEASEMFAMSLRDAGVFTFLCDHSEGDVTQNHHTDAMGTQGAEFLRLARRGRVHPWSPDPRTNCNAMESGAGNCWMLANYGCYLPGEPSPW